MVAAVLNIVSKCRRLLDIKGLLLVKSPDSVVGGRGANISASDVLYSELARTGDGDTWC